MVDDVVDIAEVVGRVSYRQVFASFSAAKVRIFADTGKFSGIFLSAPADVPLFTFHVQSGIIPDQQHSGEQDAEDAQQHGGVVQVAHCDECGVRSAHDASTLQSAQTARNSPSSETW